MKTESGMNDMNMDSTNRTARARNMRRRILASVCAIAIALLQCAVIVSVGTEDAYADTESVRIKAHAKGDYGEVTTPEKTYEIDRVTIKVKTGGGDPDPDNPDPITYKELDGVKVNKIKQETGLSGDIGQPDDAVLVKSGSKYDAYLQDGDYWTENGTVSEVITIDMEEYDPVKDISINPSEIKLKVGKTKKATVTVKYKNDIFNFDGSDAQFVKIDWTASNKNATVTPNSGLSTTVKAVKGGSFNITATDTFRQKNASASGNAETTTKATTTKKTTKHTSSSKKTSKHTASTKRTTRHSYRTGTYRTYSTRTTRSGNATTSTGTTVPTVTYAPDRTITVKEVFLGQEIIDEPEEQPTPADMMEEGWDDMNEDGSNNWEEPVDMSLDFGPMAGSAAVAVGACGAGVVGRIRKFKLDTATKAVEQVTNSKGKK